MNELDYRDKLSTKLKKRRNFPIKGIGKALANNLLKKEKKTKEYKYKKANKYMKMLEDGESKVKLDNKILYELMQHTRGHFEPELLEKSLDRFTLNKEAALVIMEGRRYRHIVFNNLDKFSGLDMDFINMIREEVGIGGDPYAPNSIQAFPIAAKILDNLDKFDLSNDDYKEILNKPMRIRPSRHNYPTLPIEEFESQKFFRKHAIWIAQYVIFNLDKFKGLSHAEIANKLLEVGEWETVAQHLTEFKLDKDELEKIKEKITNCKRDRDQRLQEKLAAEESEKRARLIDVEIAGSLAESRRPTGGIFQ